MQTLVELEGVTKSYGLGKVDVHALRGIDREILGEFAALAGPSGSGKTTLLNMIGCIDKPSGGKIADNGMDVTKTPLHALSALRRTQIGYIFQTFNLIPVLTAFENVEYPLLLSGIGKKERQSRVTNWLQHVGLEQKAKQRPDQLSGGQRQRVAIARAMVMEPRLVLAAQPGSAGGGPPRQQKAPYATSFLRSRRRLNRLSFTNCHEASRMIPGTIWR